MNRPCKGNCLVKTSFPLFHYYFENDKGKAPNQYCLLPIRLVPTSAYRKRSVSSSVILKAWFGETSPVANAIKIKNNQTRHPSIANYIGRVPPHSKGQPHANHSVPRHPFSLKTIETGEDNYNPKVLKQEEGFLSPRKRNRMVSLSPVRLQMNPL